MAVINTNLVCDLQKAVKVEYIDGVLFSQDNQANKINVTVLDGGQPATLSGTVSANIIRSDGGTVAASGGSITGNVASITLPAAAYAVPGVVSIVVKLTASGVITTIAAIVANMYRASTDTAIDPGTVMPSIQTLISQINAAVASIPADYSSLWTKLAPAFSTSASYVAGQYVTYNSGLYRFNTTHTGDWSSSDVTAVNLGGEITDLKSALGNTDELLHTGEINIPAFVQGTRYYGSYEIISNESTRLVTQKVYKVYSGDKLDIKNIASGCKVKIAGSTRLDSGWISTDTVYTFADEMYMWILAAKTNQNEDISPSDFTANIILYSKHKKDIIDIKAEIDNNEQKINDTNNLLKSRYETIFDELKYWGEDFEEESTPSMIRKNNIITLSGANNSGYVRRYAFGFACHVGQSESTLNGWTKDVHLLANHTYKIIASINSGTYSGNFSIRLRDTSNTDILTVSEENEISVNANTDVIPYLYIENGASFTDFMISVIIKDVTQDKEDFVNSFKSISDRIDVLHNSVKYWGDDAILPQLSGAQSVGVERNGTRFKLIGENQYDYAIRYSVSGAVTRVATQGSVENLQKTIRFENGHKYRLVVDIIDGSYTSSIFQLILINESKTHILELLFDTNHTHFSQDFVWNTAQSGLLYTAMSNDFSTNGIELQIIILDVTDEEAKIPDTIKRIQASRWLKSATVSPVSILHFSDIHGDGTELKKIIELYNSNKNVINSIICTGDMARASVSSDFTFWSDTEGADEIMVAMGNHEYYTNAGTDHSKYDIAAQIKKWIGDYYTNWGVVRPEGASWYYKDYTSANVRLIVLDCNLTAEEGGTTQKAWLAETLDDALENEYAVVIATHYVYLKWKGYINLNAPFTDVFEQGQETGIAYDWDCEEYITTVQEFIDNGGEFVCWLSGHTHTDNLRYVKTEQLTYDEQLDVVITAASPNHEYPITLTTGDLPREAGTPTAMAVNVVTIDTVNKWLKITRIGSNITTKMTHRDIMCYDYANHQIVF